ncbi:GAF domain-containing protein [Flexibacter flexilis DSM 6793]|uniref:histidine kinase n=1 Tax=Flexibacter flexilis DSM 6793 TaxID=927664 RepID=A0A1I1DU58_9BACT|nr:PAS domain-containing protein [Flexibacter flexilis]SFB78337.1 GAF domain-containing protein [Flexibacter flexilis DSM 6793]
MIPTATYEQEPVAANGQNPSMKQKSLEDRLWMDSTLSRFDEVLRINYDKTIEVFTDLVVAETCEIVGAISGSFFVVDEQRNIILATAGFGCTPETMAKTQFKIGEGIVGQVVKSKATRYIENVPAQSVLVASSLGSISAASLICLPLIFNEKVYGVIELISLRPLENKFQDFLERLCKNIASTLQSIQNNMRTRELLIQLQEEASQRAAQEEELRQNLEELEATQEQMQRQQSELQLLKENLEREVADQTAELKNLMQRFDLAASTTTEGLWDIMIPSNMEVDGTTPFWCSDTMRKMLGYANEQEFPGLLQNWIDLYHPEDTAAVEKAFLDHLFDVTGKYKYDIECRLRLKDGSYQWFRAVGNTLRDPQGRPIRVAGSLINVQAQKDIDKLHHELVAEKQRIELMAQTLEKVLVSLPDGLFTSDMDGNIDRFNDATLHLIAANPDHKPENAKDFLKMMRLERLNNHQRYRQKLFCLDGSTKLVELVTNSFEIGDKKQRVFYMRDITDAVRKEQDLINTLEQLEEAKSNLEQASTSNRKLKN